MREVIIKPSYIKNLDPSYFYGQYYEIGMKVITFNFTQVEPSEEREAFIKELTKRFHGAKVNVEILV